MNASLRSGAVSPVTLVLPLKKRFAFSKGLKDFRDNDGTTVSIALQLPIQYFGGRSDWAWTYLFKQIDL